MKLSKLVIPAICVTTATAVLAQQTPLPGIDYYLDFQTGIRSSDNEEGFEEPSGQSAISQTDLTFGLRSETSNQLLSVEVGGRFDFGYNPEDPDFSSDLVNPFADLEYRRTSKVSALTFEARYSETDNGLDQTLSDDAVSSDLIVDSGSSRNRRVRLAYETGLEGPVGFSLDTSARTRRVFDTTDPDLNDFDRFDLAASVFANITRTDRLSFNYRYFERDEDGVSTVNEIRNSYGIGYDRTFLSGLEMGIRLNHSINDTTRREDGVVNENFQESPTFRFNLSQPVKNGTYSFRAFSELTENGLRNEFRVGRAFETRFDGSFDLTLGINNGADVDDEGVVVGSITYSNEFERSAISFTLSHDVVVDDEDDEERTAARLFYTYEIDRLSGFNFTADYTRFNALDSLGQDRDRSSYEFAYRRALDANWDFNAGYRHTTSRDESRDDIVENRVFANIGRRFTLRP